jgi:hypothetical protein
MAPDLNTHHRELVRASYHADLTLNELWLRYFALSGDAGTLETDAYLNGVMPLTLFQHDILAHAVNERLRELPHRTPSTTTPRHTLKAPVRTDADSDRAPRPVATISAAHRSGASTGWLES